MVNYTFDQALKARQWQLQDLTPAQTHDLWEEVYQMWAVPDLDPKQPPPHSTGAALDVTLYDRQTQSSVDMGSPIDELSARSHPDYFTNLAQDANIPAAVRADAHRAEQHRRILYHAMRSAGFQRHPREWWHFSLGDQLWAWLTQQEDPQIQAMAYYGRV